MSAPVVNGKCRHPKPRFIHGDGVTAIRWEWCRVCGAIGSTMLVTRGTAPFTRTEMETDWEAPGQ